MEEKLVGTMFITFPQADDEARCGPLAGDDAGADALRAALAAARALAEDRRRALMVITAERDLLLARLRLAGLREPLLEPQTWH